MKHLLLLLTRGVLTALALLCLANAHASVTMYAVWYPTGYTNPSAKAYSGATIGGWFYVRAEVRPQSGTIIGANVDASSLEELWITYAHGPLETQPQFHGFGIEFANSWLWAHPDAPKPSNVNLSYILPVANPAPHVVVTSCWSGVNHEDPRSLMGVLRGKGTSNRVSWDRKIAVAEAGVFYNGFGSSIYEQTMKGHLDYRKAIIRGARKVKELLYSGMNLPRHVDLPVLHNEQEVNVGTE